MNDPFDVERFVVAQATAMAQIRRELEAGRKQSHWIWFVFPQLRALGRSSTALHYGIASLAEAQAYMAHPVLGPRLIECTKLVNAVQGRSVHEIFGSPDDLKFRSSMTLFAACGAEPAVFSDAIARYFEGIPDPLTLELLSGR
ncbi:MAG: DUF1810 domain-containing protein [Roseomonas sp.]|nr:DUF1810 domain-containing protein [Roseomonas sp.]MCA3430628.1 DUF1810 domain-containing protein [Roseomonas sp.]MCA3434979.1 DUF1810 domain-containing protein [Roseomonas sp.]